MRFVRVQEHAGHTILLLLFFNNTYTQQTRSYTKTVQQFIHCLYIGVYYLDLSRCHARAQFVNGYGRSTNNRIVCLYTPFLCRVYVYELRPQ